MGQKKYPDELRERATRMTLDALADPVRVKGAIRRIADELGVHPEALRTWVKKAQVDGGLRPGTTTDEAQRIKELEKEVRELRRANAILKNASACLSRRSVSARPVDLSVHRDQEGGVRGLADLQGAHWRRSQDRPARATPWSRKSRASHAGEGAFSPMEAILSCTLIGPWSKPERSRAARTSRAWERTASGRRAGLERGRRDRGSSTAAGPSRRARRRKT